jgi:hypothetical protein
MPFKPKILFIGDYCRVDYLSLLKDAIPYCDFYFLYYSSVKEEINKNYLQAGTAIYWSDFLDVYDLLHHIQPDKTIFLYVESYNSMVLNLACKETGITTYHLEHGLRADYVLGFDPAYSPYPRKTYKTKIKDFLKVILQLKTRLRSRKFFLNSINKLHPEDAAFAKKFFQIRSRHNFLETFRILNSPKRKPQIYISFSPKVYQVHQIEDKLTADQAVHFIGVPYFDDLAHVKAKTTENYILFIDQPLVEHHLLGWRESDRAYTLKNLYQVCKKYNYKLFVKLHPKQSIKSWRDLNTNDNIEFAENHQLPKIAEKVKVVIGFYSTLLLPFAALPHITLLTFENHPAGKLDVSKPFIDAGVAHPIYNLKELSGALENIDQLHRQQLPHKNTFEKEWLFKFDGKAGERLRDILLD